MPTYEFKCDNCGRTRDVFATFTTIDHTTVMCDCRTKMRRVFSAAMIQFKGGGFYTTDTRKPSREVKKDASGDSAKSEVPTSSDRKELPASE